LNQPILFHWIDKLTEIGVKRIVINAHHLSKQIVKGIEKSQKSVELILSVEPKILGTGGGLKNAAHLLFPCPTSGADELFYVINSDIYTDLDPRRLIETQKLSPGAPATVALVDRPAKATVSLDRDGRIVAFRAPAPVPGEDRRLCGAGIMVMERWFLESLPDGFSDTVDCFQTLLEQKNIRPGGHFFPQAAWTDIGSLAEYMALNKKLAQGQIILSQPEQIQGRLSGFVLAEAGARAEPGSLIEDSILLKGSLVEKGAVVRAAVVAGRIPAGTEALGGIHL
jgi:mannose-1-phosphate guanylyltransferase